MKGQDMNNEARRSGMDRRSKKIPIESDIRKGKDRRKILDETGRMAELLKKIPIFSGLTDDQYRKILFICYNKTLPGDLFIYEQDDKSDSMFLLLQGQIKILFHKSTLVTFLDPVSLFGEIGFFTGEQRSTSAVTT